MALGLDFEGPAAEIEKKIEELKNLEAEGEVSFQNEIVKLEEKRDTLLTEIYSQLTPWQITQVARHPNRPLFDDYIDLIFTDYVELHGDRNIGDDKAIGAGFAYLDGEKVFVLGHQKGKNTKSNVERNFGMPNPEGYRKALRVMEMANKFDKPIITFIDTPGAFPGLEAEERGQGEAIAKNLFMMSTFEVPIISIVVGEGGSGGALALGVADRMLMLSNSIYSVISPEGCASILWKDATKASEAAEALKVTAKDLLGFNLIDGIVEEPVGGAHRNYELTTNRVKKAILANLKQIKKLSKRKLVEKRHEKFSKMGNIFNE